MPFERAHGRTPPGDEAHANPASDYHRDKDGTPPIVPLIQSDSWPGVSTGWLPFIESVNASASAYSSQYYWQLPQDSLFSSFPFPFHQQWLGDNQVTGGAVASTQQHSVSLLGWPFSYYLVPAFPLLTYKNKIDMTATSVPPASRHVTMIPAPAASSPSYPDGPSIVRTEERTSPELREVREPLSSIKHQKKIAPPVPPKPNSKRSIKSRNVTAAKKRSKPVKSKAKKDSQGKPRQLLSAYNFFFQEERLRLIAHATHSSSAQLTLGLQHQNQSTSNHLVVDQCRSAETPCGPPRHVNKKQPPPHGVGFAAMAQSIAAKWKRLDPIVKSKYDDLAANDKLRYKTEKLDYVKIQREQQTQDRIKCLASRETAHCARQAL